MSDSMSFDFTELEDLDHSLHLDEAQTSGEKVAYQHLRTRYLPEDQQ